MKRLISLTLALLLINGCSREKTPGNFLGSEYLFVTSPPANLELSERQKEYLILFKHGFSNDEIINYFKTDKARFNEEINFLFSNNLIKKSDNNFLPAFPVISYDDYNDMLNKLDTLIKDVGTIALDRLEKIESEYNKNKMNRPFKDAAYYVVRDYAVMKNLSDFVIKTEPPARGTARFYAALFEKKIFSSAGLNNKKFFNEDEIKTLERIAKITQKDITEYFEKQTPRLVKYYLSSGFKDQAGFREWLFWCGYAIADKATDLLNKNGYINLPAPVDLVMK
ncbi:hypothetical protein MROS_0909 [Melioribacter roseus P3M-2]|uniref:Uncharacterized protein n=1 Tax=Melioribacter roseus (strain DSM 23840 / JCM 17771 / VKM B-2668 / P3M-2) TaxID=1191523 RepID=I6Z4S5_MELRP|nr:hypothetical protein [Melioribacter roseus]AFN74150.1 hypothetical protein MROS_0909 [Melioribacter roseus P3M-2]